MSDCVYKRHYTYCVCMNCLLLSKMFHLFKNIPVDHSNMVKPGQVERI